MSDTKMQIAAHAIITLGRGRGDLEENYPAKCAAATRCLANTDSEEVALAVSSLNANKESGGALFIGDALRMLAIIIEGADILPENLQ
jgi:hypothetical protein